jgi:hypothetical protein
MERAASDNTGNHWSGALARSDSVEQMAPRLALADVAIPGISKSALPISTREKKNEIGLASNNVLPISKSQAATASLRRRSPNPTLPPGNREYSLSISFLFLSVPRIKRFRRDENRNAGGRAVAL